MKPLRLLIAFALVCAIAPRAALSEERLAIVFGNDAYEHADRLANAVNDAQAVANLLEKVLGFTLVKPPKGGNVFAARENIWKDTGINRFYEGLEAFKKEAATAQIGLIYYAGHGMEVGAVNYLLPVDAKLEVDSELRSQAVTVDEVLDDLKSTGLPAKLLILDCCRNNPLPTRSWVRSRTKTNKGLAAIADTKLPEATMILFSAGPGQEALDGVDGNSPFTAALVKELPQPGRSAFDAFLKVSDTVTAVTGKRQEPWLKFDGAGRTFRAFQFVAGDAPVPTMPQDGTAAKLASMQAKLEEAEGKAAAALAMSKTPTIPVSPAAALALSKTPTLPVSPDPGSFSTAPANPRGFTNTLGMTFLPVPGTDVLFCEHETRVKDYAAYAAANPGVDMSWTDCEYEGHKQTSDHPVINVSWEDARAFCVWLSAKEGKLYRLPTDHEWSVAIGIGGQENASASAKDKDINLAGYPWGSAWPPPTGAGNFNPISGYNDSHPFTAPVKSYKIGKHGLYDMSGNVTEWCEDLWSKQDTVRVLRGGSWGGGMDYFLRSSYRGVYLPSLRLDTFGFRCVVTAAGTAQLDPFQVTITEVIKGGQGEALGLQVGDSYVSYDGQAITSMDQFIALTEESKGEGIPLEVLRDGRKLTFTAKPGKFGTVITNSPLPPDVGNAPAKIGK